VFWLGKPLASTFRQLAVIERDEALTVTVDPTGDDQREVAVTVRVGWT
jgi:hypothetical protein